MRHLFIPALALLGCAAIAGLAHGQGNGRLDSNMGGDAAMERGNYVAIIGGCNDCHTAGYDQREGQVPRTEWLKGVPVGFRGPWGTTYPANLRLYFAAMTEDQWVGHAHTLRTRPPMPWLNIQAMSEPDLRALYRFVRALPGDAGAPAPDYVPPNEKPKTPFIVFVPQPPG